MVHEYGEIPLIKKKLETVESLREAFDTYPDEQERERVRQDMNRYTLYGQKERRKKKAHKKETKQEWVHA